MEVNTYKNPTALAVGVSGYLEDGTVVLRHKATENGFLVVSSDYIEFNDSKNGNWNIKIWLWAFKIMNNQIVNLGGRKNV